MKINESADRISFKFHSEPLPFLGNVLRAPVDERIDLARSFARGHRCRREIEGTSGWSLAKEVHERCERAGLKYWRDSDETAISRKP